MEAKKLLKKHLDIHIPKGEYRSEKQLIQLRYDACIDAINEAINYSRSCKSDSEQLVCEKCNGTGGYSYVDKKGFNYKTCECQTN